MSISDIQTLFNAALFVVWALFLRSMLEPRFSAPVSLGLALCCFLIWFWTSASTGAASLLRTVIGLSDLFGFALLIFKSRWPRVLFSAGIAFAAMIFNEIVLLVLFPSSMESLSGIADEPSDMVTAVGVAVLSLLLNSLLLWIASKVFGRYKRQLSTREWLLLAPFFVSQLALALSWYALYVNGVGMAAYIWIGCAAAVTLAADIGLNSAMRGIAQRAELRAEKVQLEKQIDVQKDHYAALTEQYENVRRMRHDIAKHVYTIKLLLERGETAQAESYAAELLPNTEYRSSLGQCENPVVDAFLYNRIEELRTQGYRLSVQVVLPAYVTAANSDLIIAFGNLLDNASEACRGLADSYIELKAGIKKGYLVIETENPLPPESAAEKKRRIPELERGVGLSILRELAQKYDGAFSCSADKGSFTAVLSLREEGEDAANSGV